MKKLLTILLALSLITGCSAENTAPEGTETDENDTTTSAKVKMAETTTSSEAPETVPSYQEDDSSPKFILTAKNPREAYKTKRCLLVDDSAYIKAEADFPNEEHIRLAKEYTNIDDYVVDERNYYNSYVDEHPEENMKRVDSGIDDIDYLWGISADFDNNGENESVIALYYGFQYYWMGDCAILYVDGKTVYPLVMYSNTPEADLLIYDDFTALLLHTSAGAIAYFSDIYTFYDKVPKKVLIPEGNDYCDSHELFYNNGYFTLCYKSSYEECIIVWDDKKEEF